MQRGGPRILHQPPGGPQASPDVTRRDEILDAAATLIAAGGLRTSLQQIADQAGILPGSLYHHFDSKDAILVELMRRYHADLDRIGEAAQAALDAPGYAPGPDRVAELGTAIARCAVRHRAALQMSFFELPSSSPELIELVRQPPTAVQQAMLGTLRAARWNGGLRPGLDLPVVADRVCQTMLHVGLDVIRRRATPDGVAGLFCRILLNGLVSHEITDPELDRSAAFAAADEVVRTWGDERTVDARDKPARVRAAARAEFGRRGFETTTIRDIAAAAGLGVGTVHRLLGSKEEALAAIMRVFGERVGAGWTAVFRSDATVSEKLDAITWVNINALDQFPDEFRIQLAWMRQAPPDSPDPGWFFDRRLRQLKSLVSGGIRSGELRIDTPSRELLARCVIGIQWVPENILVSIGKRDALVLARDTVLRGIATRPDAAAEST